MAEFLFHKGSPTYLQPENADVMNISQFMAQNLRQAPPPLPPQPKHTFEISEGESVEIEKIVAAEKKDGQLFYKVKWVKYTWEAETSIQHLPHLIDGYWREHFYQNINQAVIDTSAIAGVTNTTEGDFARNKSVVVNPADNRDVQKAVVAAVQQQAQQTQQQVEKITTVSTDQTTVVNGAVLSAVAGNVGEHSDVILEFSMPQNKVDHAYQNRLVTVGPTQAGADKKARRSYPLERKYLCTVCQKAFDRNTSLTRHMLVHTREKPFKCQLCDKAFSQNAHLKRHILIHIGQKSYQCNKCGKMFIEKGGLARHEATHSTEKPWVCNQCGKAFVLNEYLQRHLFLHTGQKPYQCNECGRLFADGSSWRAHKLTHNKEKKYKCHICQKMLKCKRNFKKHVQAHSEDKDMKHRCEICEERFPNKKMLREHYRRSKKLHRCKTCRKFLKSRERFLVHAEYHDPASDLYDPNAKVPGDELDDEKEDDIRSDMDDGSNKSDDDMHRSDDEHDMDVGPSHPGTTVVVNVSQQRDEEILTKILESSKNVVVQQSDQNTGPAVSALTALYMKAENSDESVSHHQLQTQNENNENGHVIQTISSSIGASSMTNNLRDSSSPVDLSIQLVSSGEHVQPQFSNVSGVDMSHITQEGHIGQLSRHQGPSTSSIDVVGSQIVQVAPDRNTVATTVSENENNRENIITSEQRTNDGETIILISQNNEVDMQQM